MLTTTDEMIERGPHTGSYHQLDYKEVWQVVRHVRHGGSGWSLVQSYQQRTCDGRQPYLAIETHYLGESYSARIRSNADNVIDNSFFDGKSRTFTFERYCEVLKATFTDIEATGEDVQKREKFVSYSKELQIQDRKH
jgi:hypothetical protein